MMEQLLYISQRGNTFDLTDNEYCWLLNVDGQTAAATDIAAVVVGGIDGDEINNIQAQPRGIILDLRIKQHVNVESAKRAILNYIKIKQSCTLQWTQNNKVVTISGVVDSISMPRYENGVTMQVSIHCGQPFWQDLNEIITEISDAIDLHYFTDQVGGMLYFTDVGRPLGEIDTSRTRSFLNEGDVAVGMIIEIFALKTVTNPIMYDQNNNFFGVGYGSKSVVMNAGDKLIINTNKGHKSVYLNDTPLFDKIKPQSTWLQLEAGENEFSVNSDDVEIDNMVFTLEYKQRYV